MRELLTERYGKCELNRSFAWPTKPQDYRNTGIGEALQTINNALGTLRGHGDFIKSDLVPPSDFFVADPPFILEFDESQHFTKPRLVSLALYPEDIRLGFSLDRWQELCRQIDAQDSVPVDRDERRAWYDTLRDLVPAVYGFKPTVRIYAEQIVWCSLDPASVRDREIFNAYLKDRLPKPG